MFLHVLISASLLSADPQSALPEPKREVYGASLFPKRIQVLLNGLAAPLPLERPIESLLKEVIEYLEDVSSPPEAAKDPSKRIRILIDHPAFQKRKDDTNYKIEEEMVRLPKLVGSTLESALLLLCEQLDATFVVRKEHIEITTWEKALGRNRNLLEQQLLVYWGAKKVPLEELVEQLSDHYQVSVVISPQSGEKARTLISAKLMNVPFESAIETIAEMASLKAIRKDKVIYITPVVETPKTTELKSK
jgi:hypothetical protein